MLPPNIHFIQRGWFNSNHLLITGEAGAVRMDSGHRLAARNANLPPGTFHVTQAQLDLWDGWFERPSPDELRN
jgi:predicted kinase